MPSFKIKDLMVHLPDEGAARGGAQNPAQLCNFQTCNPTLCIAPTVPQCGFNTCNPTLCASPTVQPCGFHTCDPTLCASPTVQPCGFHTCNPTLCASPTLCLAPTVQPCGFHTCDPTLCASPTLCAAPTHQPCGFHTCNPTLCASPTLIPCGHGTLGCVLGTLPCFGLSGCGVTEYTPTIVQTLTPEINPQVLSGIRSENLEILRTQLKQALANIDQQTQTSEERLAPQTLAEVETLEQKLKEALDELQARKADLQQGSTDKQ